MTKNIRIILVFLLVLCAQIAVAQDISVASFRLLENDLTANTHGTMEKDFNGETAALIKVMTTEKGFVFDGGMVGIVKTKQMTGEVWVYVPHGIKKVTIMHDNLGVLRDYYFPISIEKARTYEMKLTTGRVVTTVERKADKQYVMFNVTPTNAVVELDGMPLDVDSEGYAEKSMPYGTYDYRVSCANYHTEAGKLTVSSAGKVEKNISLRPNFGWIEFRGVNEYHGAHVYIDGERIGQLPLKSDGVKSGTHQVKILKQLYKPFEQQVIVTENSVISLNVELVPNFANITFDTDAENEIWIDGRQRGKGKCTIGLELGEYSVEVKRPSHRTVSDVITISELTDHTIKLSSPTPIYGVFDISSLPSRAMVLVDGVEVGQTPLILDNMLVGSHEVILKKGGYKPCEKTLVLKENADNRFVIKLEVENPEVSNVVNGVKKTYTVNGVSFVMIDVEGGSFMMGATSEQGKDAESDEKPIHEVTLSSYSIGETEVTQELWQAVMGRNPSYFIGNLQRPVERVSWNDCQTFIKKLNQLTGENFRLPTEAEWEYAARGGKFSKGYKYSGSNSIGDVAWYSTNSLNATYSVKVKQPNELGIYDMSGGVSEWCSDWYESFHYSSVHQTNPTGPLSGINHVLRGGSWYDNSRDCRVAFRNTFSVGSKRHTIGFRLAK